MSAVVLLSGGLDSATAYAIALKHESSVYPFHVTYGQRHGRETNSAYALAAHYGAVLMVASVSMPIAGSALTDTSVDVPRGGVQPGIPVSYVPARNTFLLGLAASFAESIGAGRIYVGFNAVDYSGYPDCRPEFVVRVNDALQAGMSKPAKVFAPIIAWSKKEIVATAIALNVPLEHTWSCYIGAERPCGECDSCRIRDAAFADLGEIDPVVQGRHGTSVA